MNQSIASIVSDYDFKKKLGSDIRTVMFHGTDLTALGEKTIGTSREVLPCFSIERVRVAEREDTVVEELARLVCGFKNDTLSYFRDMVCFKASEFCDMFGHSTKEKVARAMISGNFSFEDRFIIHMLFSPVFTVTANDVSIAVFSESEQELVNKAKQDWEVGKIVGMATENVSVNLFKKYFPIFQKKFMNAEMMNGVKVGNYHGDEGLIIYALLSGASIDEICSFLGKERRIENVIEVIESEAGRDLSFDEKAYVASVFFWKRKARNPDFMNLFREMFCMGPERKEEINVKERLLSIKFLDFAWSHGNGAFHVAQKAGLTEEGIKDFFANGVNKLEQDERKIIQDSYKSYKELKKALDTCEISEADTITEYISQNSIAGVYSCYSPLATNFHTTGFHYLFKRARLFFLFSGERCIGKINAYVTKDGKVVVRNTYLANELKKYGTTLSMLISDIKATDRAAETRIVSGDKLHKTWKFYVD